MRIFVQALIVVSMLTFFSSRSVYAGTTVPPMKRVVWVWLENISYSSMITQKYTRSLFNSMNAARFSNYTSPFTFAQPSRLDLISGFPQGVSDNAPVQVFSPTLVDLLEARGLEWKVYSEDYPGACFQGDKIGNYRKNRVPFLSLAKVQADLYLCMKMLNFAFLSDDIRHDRVPQVSIVIPNLNSSGATSSPAVADARLKAILSPLISNPVFMADTTIIITTTNTETTKKLNDPNLFTMILGRGVSAKGITLDVPYTHANLLKTLEEGLGLGSLGQEDAQAKPVDSIWQ